MDGSIVAIVAVVVAGINVWVNTWATLRAAKANQTTVLEQQLRQYTQTRRDQERDDLLSLMVILREERSKLQFLSNKDRYNTEPIYPGVRARAEEAKIRIGWEREREEAYGRAYAVLLCVPDEEIRIIAEDVMKKKDRTEKNRAIEQGLIRLGIMLDKLHHTDK
jgi:hypothetical protein